jgi:hypothetical protein
VEIILAFIITCQWLKIETFINEWLFTIRKIERKVSHMSADQLLDGFMLKKQMEQQKVPAKPLDSEVFGDVFKDISSVKIVSLQEIMQDIQILITARESLKKELFSDIEHAKLEISSILSKIPFDATTQPAVTAEHLKLRQKMVELEESKMQEKLNCWRDIALLKKELRENVRESEDKKNNLSMLGKLID